MRSHPEGQTVIIVGLGMQRKAKKINGQVLPFVF